MGRHLIVEWIGLIPCHINSNWIEFWIWWTPSLYFSADWSKENYILETKAPQLSLYDQNVIVVLGLHVTWNTMYLDWISIRSNALLEGCPVCGKFHLYPCTMLVTMSETNSRATHLMTLHPSRNTTQPVFYKKEKHWHFFCEFKALCIIVEFHQPRLVIRTFHRQGRCSRGGHLCNEHSEEKYSCSYK